MSSFCSSFSPNECAEPARASRREVALRRWKILARALHGENCATSVAHFTTFKLAKLAGPQHGNEPTERNNDYISNADWYQYSTTVDKKKYTILVRQPTRSFTAAELMGFNNTGNVCVWPSEEVLAYYALCNLSMFAGKRTLELGGGMTCLAGLMVAKYSDATEVCLTDGNESAIQNVGAIVGRNCLGKDVVSCGVMQWGSDAGGMAAHDVILCADCLFFDDARHALVETMWTALAARGVVLVMAPRRGDTLDKFAEEARARGFSCRVYQYYNEHVWRHHQELKRTNDYREDVHYPMLVRLTK